MDRRRAHSTRGLRRREVRVKSVSLPAITIGAGRYRGGAECAEVRVPGAGADAMVKAMQIVTGAVAALAREDVVVREPEFEYHTRDGVRWVAGKIIAFPSEALEASTAVAVHALASAAQREATLHTLRHPLGITTHRVLVVNT